MPFQTISVALVESAEGRLGRLELARPERLNAMGASLLRELAAAAGYQGGSAGR